SPRRPIKAQPIRRTQPAQTVRPLRKLIPHTQSHRRLHLRHIRDRSQPQPLRFITTHHHRKRILEPQPWPHTHTISLLIQPSYLLVHARLITCARFRQWLLQNRRQRRPRVLHIAVDAVRDQRLLTQITSRQPESSLNFPSTRRLNLLRQQFSQHHLLGKILRPNHNVRGPRRRTRRQRKQSQQHGRRFHRRTTSRFSANPSTPPAHNASSAAGTAPASTSPLSTLATPRKMSSPNPPAPIAAAIVATPTHVTVAVRSPARITLAAIGNSTLRSRCHPVIPSAFATSMTAGSTLLIPAYVLRRIGSSAYAVSATIASRAARSPRNGTGSNSPNIARLGIVCSTFATPITGLASACLRVSSTPSGSPIAHANSIALAVSHTCSNVSRVISAPCCTKNEFTPLPRDASQRRKPALPRSMTSAPHRWRDPQPPHRPPATPVCWPGTAPPRDHASRSAWSHPSVAAVRAASSASPRGSAGPALRMAHPSASPLAHSPAHGPHPRAAAVLRSTATDTSAPHPLAAPPSATSPPPARESPHATFLQAPAPSPHCARPSSAETARSPGSHTRSLAAARSHPPPQRRAHPPARGHSSAAPARSPCAAASSCRNRSGPAAPSSFPAPRAAKPHAKSDGHPP